MKRLKLLLVLLTILCSCQKDYLAKKPAKSLLIPVTLTDFQSLLDDVMLMNINYSVSWLAVDDFATTDAGLLSFSLPEERNSYTWSVDIFEGGQSVDWNQCYQQVFNANVVIDGLQDFVPANPAQREQHGQIRGAALFYRAMAFYNLLQQFAVPYSIANSSTAAGIPLRVSSDVNIKLQRANLKDSYNQVLNDFEIATELLPLNQLSKTRPTKAASLALMSRTYLLMSQYENALLYAERCLQMDATLLDYNLGSPILIPTGNAEVLYNAANSGYTFLNSTVSGATSDLYALYDNDDLRKQYYFLVRANGTFGFRQMNAQSIGRFAGLAIDELYLIKAECEARLNHDDHGMSTLNALLNKRWRTNTFIPFTAQNATEALVIILRERRKELINRGIRWSDLRRLNQEFRFAVDQQRTVNGITYTLPANDKRYTYPIPQNEINASGIEQNER